MNRILVYGMTNNLGGIETYLMNELGLLDKSKAIFDFVVDFPTMAYQKEADALGCRTYFIPAKSKGMLAQWKALWKLLRAHPEYKMLYFNILDAGAAVTMLIPWLLGRKILVHSHNNDTDKKRLHALCKPALNLFAKKRYACSQSAAAYMYGAKKAEIIFNAIDTAQYAFSEETRGQKRRELNIEDRYVICHVGRLSRQKNVEGLLDIYREICETEKDAILISVGDGEDRDKIHQYAEKLGIRDRVMFLGKRDDVPQILQAADVFVLPSLYEGLGIAAIEAQAAGLPCILSTGVPRDAGIADNVEFLALDEEREVWKRRIMAYRGHERAKNAQEALIAAGYDLGHPGEAQRRLLDYFETGQEEAE